MISKVGLTSPATETYSSILLRISTASIWIKHHSVRKNTVNYLGFSNLSSLRRSTALKLAHPLNRIIPGELYKVCEVG